MEGVAGISTLRQVWRGSDDFPASRRLMTLEANAAIEGSFDGGATGVVVNDSNGDDKACQQAAKRLPGLRTVVVKEADGRGVARSMHPSRARAAIRSASAEAVRAAGGGELQPFVTTPPHVLEADLATTSAADLC